MAAMNDLKILHRLVLIFLFLFSLSYQPKRALAQDATVDVGVILDLKNMDGNMSQVSMAMAVEDFYATHGNNTARMVLHTTVLDPDAIGAASAALKMLKDIKVAAIIGPLTSTDAVFVIDLGDTAQVPIVSFSATSPGLSAAKTPYFVRTTVNDSSQVSAVAAIVQNFSWYEVVTIYEDSDYGTGIVSYLVHALQGVQGFVPYRSVIPPAATDDQLEEELKKLMTMQTRVFVVHMFPELGSRLFQKANEMGMMSEGYVWIITDGFANYLDLLDQSVIQSMQGVIGVRPYVNRATTQINNFKQRFISRFSQQYPGSQEVNPNAFQLWAYDTVWALALALEKVGAATSPVFEPVPPGTATSAAGGDPTCLDQFNSSRTGPTLLDAIQNVRFSGLAGEFRLVDGQYQSPAYEIVNIGGQGVRQIGLWAPEMGSSQSPENKLSVDGLKIFWPGNSSRVPRGWDIPTDQKKLKIVVPAKAGFKEFVDVDATGIVSGYCIEVFDLLMNDMPFNVTYEYKDFKKGTYDDLLGQVHSKEFDAAVGDITILYDRSKHVDFTFPYTDSGFSMIVPLEAGNKKDMFIFVKPLTYDLWFWTVGFYFATGSMVWLIEQSSGNEELHVSWRDFWGFVATFPANVNDRSGRLKSTFSKTLMVAWLFLMMTLTSSYTASLASMLTVEKLEPTMTDITQLQKNGEYVGYQDESFIREVLINQFHFSSDKLKNLSSVEDYFVALNKGSASGGVGAIVDEIPYIKIFLSNYCNNFTMAGPTYQTQGFGFAFPIGSPLVPHVSRAVLKATESRDSSQKKLADVEKKYFDQTCPNQGASMSSNTSLDFRSFAGLFIIMGCFLGVGFFLALYRGAFLTGAIWLIDWGKVFALLSPHRPEVAPGDGGAPHYWNSTGRQRLSGRPTRLHTFMRNLVKMLRIIKVIKGETSTRDHENLLHQEGIEQTRQDLGL